MKKNVHTDATSAILVRMTPDTAKKLKAVAAMRGMNKSDLIAELLALDAERLMKDMRTT